MDKIICDHCGDDCGRHIVKWDEKSFCCEGCKTVFQILNENKLGGYYDIYKSPGIKLESEDFGNKFSYLDNEEIASKIIYFSEGNYNKVKFYIPEIHCSSCIWLLENLYQLNKAITLSNVNFVKKEIDITYQNKEISLRQLVELLASIHYVPYISLESVDGIKNSHSNKKTIFKIGVAGFVFGNTMLLSMPEYIPGKELVDESFRHFFGYLNILLALPVLLYSANDYLISAYKNIKHKIINIDFPISIGIIAIFLESSYEIISGVGSGYMDSLAGLVFFLLIGKWYQNHTYQALSFERDYKSYFPIAITKYKDGKEFSDLLSNLKVGDVVVVRNQELIPADGILLSGKANINYSFVTGESKPISKSKGEEVYAGGKQIGNAIQIEITKEVSQSKLTQLWNQEFDKSAIRKNLTTLIDVVSHRFTFIILSIAFISSIIWWFIEPAKIILVFSSVLIVACPCALALAIPFTFGNTQRMYGRAGFYLKNPQVVEDLTKVNTIVFDKTGTITYSDSVNIQFVGKELNHSQLVKIKSLTRQSGHPLSAAIYTNLNTEIIDEIPDFKEIPSMGLSGTLDNVKVKLGSAEYTDANEEIDKDPQTSKVYISFDNVYFGYFSISNRYRNNIQVVINELKEHFELHLISGDNEAEKSRLTEIFGNDKNLYFNQSPQQKLEYIKALKDSGKNILMVGDGLNDAGALKESHVGISIADDVFQFSPACDAILEAKQFQKLNDFILLNKRSLRIVYSSFVISFMYNIVGLSFAVSGQLSPIIAAILMPASSITVVGFVTIMTRMRLKKIYIN